MRNRGSSFQAGRLIVCANHGVSGSVGRPGGTHSHTIYSDDHGGPPCPALPRTLDPAAAAAAAAGAAAAAVAAGAAACCCLLLLAAAQAASAPRALWVASISYARPPGSTPARVLCSLRVCIVVCKLCSDCFVPSLLILLGRFCSDLAERGERQRAEQVSPRAGWLHCVLQPLRQLQADPTRPGQQHRPAHGRVLSGSDQGRPLDVRTGLVSPGDLLAPSTQRRRAQTVPRHPRSRPRHRPRWRPRWRPPRWQPPPPPPPPLLLLVLLLLLATSPSPPPVLLLMRSVLPAGGTTAALATAGPPGPLPSPPTVSPPPSWPGWSDPSQ